MPFVSIPKKVRAMAIDLYVKERRASDAGNHDSPDRHRWEGFYEAMKLMLPEDTVSVIYMDCACVADGFEPLTDVLHKVLVGGGGEEQG